MLTKRALRYLLLSAFLVLFNIIYGLFAHGVRSLFMQLAFLFPLIGGSLVSMLLIFLPPISEIDRNLWNMGITTLIIGSLLNGVFDIYGSSSMLVNVFFILGGMLLLASLTLYIFNHVKAKRGSSK